jgi:hypothetical protein
MSPRDEAAAILTRLGLDAHALSTGRTPPERLGELVGGAEGPALARALGELATPAVAATLVALEARATDRATRKEIRRSLYRLRQRGVAIPEATVAAPAARVPVAPLAEGFLSHVDGRGDRLAWIVRSLSGGGVLLIAAQLNEPEGLRDVQALEVARKALRAMRHRLEVEAKLRLVPADWRVVDALLVEAHERVGAPERARDYLRVRPQLTADPARPPAEPASARVEVPSAAETPTLAAAATALLEQPEIGSWLPGAEALAPFAEEIAGLRDSPLVLSQLQQQDRALDVVRRAVRALFPAPVFVRRLEATAYVLAETGRPAAARQALAVARLLRERPGEVGDGGLFAALVQQALGGMLATATARREDEQRGSLVVTPGQFLRDRSSARRGRTRA